MQAPERIFILESRVIISISCGGQHTLAIDNSGYCFSWGYGAYGQLGHGASNNYKAPRCIEKMMRYVILQALAGEHFSALLTTNNSVFTCGLGSSG